MEGSRFCTACGASLADTVMPRPGGANGSAAERRLMTVLFSDLIGSSALAARLDPEDFAKLLVAYRERCAAAVTRHGGYVSRYAGDGVVACFGYPRAVGRDAHAAVACGLSIAREIHALARDTPLRGGRDLAVRIGIETGLVVAGTLGPGNAVELDGLVGTAPNTAARLQQLAAPNGVVIGETTYELIGDDFNCEELPAHRLARLPEPARAFIVRGSADRGGERLLLTRRLMPLAGRRTEFDLLRERWTRAEAGRGQTVLLSGEAGIGKSRLCQELVDYLADRPHRRIILRCTPPAASSAFYVVIEALSDELTRASGENRVTLEAVSRLAEDLDIRGAPGEAIVAQALGLEPAPVDLAPVSRRRWMLDTLQAWLLDHARELPLLILAEDLHWSDPSSLELLHELTDLLTNRRIMLVATYRSNFVLPWPDRSTTLRISLPPLEPLEAQQLLDTLERVQKRETREEILAKSDGVPLFLEEFAFATTPVLPRTLQQLFTARLDSLGKAKRLAQCAAVLDPHIEPDILAALASLPNASVETGLTELVDAELLVHAGAPPATSFAFRHALLREAAKDSILLSDLRAMHGKTAGLLRSMRPALAERRPEVVAHHLLLGEEFGEAVPFFVQATRRALDASALEEAEAHVNHGLEAFEAARPRQSPELELELRVLLGHVLIARRGYANAAVQEAFEGALAVAERVPDQTRTLPALRGLASFYQVRGPLSRAEAICERLLTAAERVGGAPVLTDAWRRRGWNRTCMGRLAEAEEDLSRALNTFEPLRRAEHIATAGHDPEVLALANLAWLYVRRHGVAQAADRADATADKARASPHPVSACYGLVLAALILQQAGRWDDALAHVNKALEIAAEKGFAYWVAMSEVAIGFDQAVHRGDVDRGSEAIRAGLASYRETQGELLRPFILSLLAQAHVASGDLDWHGQRCNRA